MKFKEFKKKLHSSKKLLIFMHNYPDPDSITSAFFLQKIANKFKLKSKIVYQGKVTREENLNMIKLLNLKIHFFKKNELSHYDLIAGVDFQPENTNHAIPQGIYPQIIFDHHPFIPSENKKKTFFEINSKIGSTATIILDYFFHFNLKLNTKLSTAYSYTILTETNYFNRNHTKKDIDFFKQCINTTNFKIISKIENTPKGSDYYSALKIALNRYHIKERILFCHLGMIKNLELVQEIAEFFIKRSDILFTIITGKKAKLGKISCRSKVKQIHLGKILKNTLKNYGDGGGHAMMAAGNFVGKEKNLINFLIKNINSSLSAKKVKDFSLLL